MPDVTADDNTVSSPRGCSSAGESSTIGCHVLSSNDRLTMIPKFLLQYFSRLRFPWLFGLTALLLAIDAFVWDPLPFMDELLLGLVTLLLGAWRAKKSERFASKPSPEQSEPARLEEQPDP